MSNKKNTENKSVPKPSRGKGRDVGLIVNREKKQCPDSRTRGDNEITQMHSTPPKPGSGGTKNK
ncbi:hypothetical protein D2H50_21360 [Vibrio parahaemolyticus]|uniref:hypothetical protein n=1 Tax=Vibrio parahaemolyticus TaxID=670 RepID=UPI001D6F34A2|nr:hypothetical protein [Vibrio parahaemolyticus]EGR1952140.1 hypothetical protein [Vibrio parahaemolyticus]ELA7157836.1 hypothetical protein [Vibrio parahaemolyticus]MCR9726847.1 hypothetical protein [Vibrio parahaemolyticus]MCR9742180.1 hypothetical protein [Vibrio parahaemolyticus]HCG7769784.1 hypothetical protein [Vibrio parahaemolyticus]